MASYIVFVAGVSNAVGDVVGCAIVTGLLHYLFLATWCWMCVYSYEMHNSLVKVRSDDVVSENVTGGGGGGGAITTGQKLGKFKSLIGML